MLCVFKGMFTSRLISTRLASVIEAGKFGQPIGRLSESTNRQPDMSSLSQQSWSKNFQYKHILSQNRKCMRQNIGPGVRLPVI